MSAEPVRRRKNRKTNTALGIPRTFPFPLLPTHECRAVNLHMMTLKILFHMDVKCCTRKLEIPIGWVCCFPGHWTLQRKDSPRLPNAQPEAPFQRLRQVPERLLCCAIRETVVDRYRRRALAAFVSLTVGIDPAKPSQELTGKLRAADLQVTRLPPSAFPELPKSIRRGLERPGGTNSPRWGDQKTPNTNKRGVPPTRQQPHSPPTL